MTLIKEATVKAALDYVENGSIYVLNIFIS